MPWILSVTVLQLRLVTKRASNHSGLVRGDRDLFGDFALRLFNRPSPTLPYLPFRQQRKGLGKGLAIANMNDSAAGKQPLPQMDCDGHSVFENDNG